MVHVEPRRCGRNPRAEKAITRLKYDMFKIMRLYYTLQCNIMNIERLFNKEKYQPLNKELDKIQKVNKRARKILAHMRKQVPKIRLTQGMEDEVNTIIRVMESDFINIAVNASLAQIYTKPDYIVELKQQLNIIKTYNKYLTLAAREFQAIIGGL